MVSWVTRKSRVTRRTWVTRMIGVTRITRMTGGDCGDFDSWNDCDVLNDWDY